MSAYDHSSTALKDGFYGPKRHGMGMHSVLLALCEGNAMVTSEFPAQQGWGLLSQFFPFRYFLNFSSLSKHTLAVKYRVYIWQVSPQLSCGDTCQIWMWFEESNMYFCKIEYFAYGEINERSFSNPHPRSVMR